jgi:hypothetical protein
MRAIKLMAPLFEYLNALETDDIELLIATHPTRIILEGWNQCLMPLRWSRLLTGSIRHIEGEQGL